MYSTVHTVQARSMHNQLCAYCTVQHTVQYSILYSKAYSTVLHTVQYCIQYNTAYSKVELKTTIQLSIQNSTAYSAVQHK